MTDVLAGPKCLHCGSSFIVTDGEDTHCLMCCRPYDIQRYYGSQGGRQTVNRYGNGNMSELGKRGGRPRLKSLTEVKAASVPNGQIEEREVMTDHPNSLKALKELYKLQIKQGADGHELELSAPKGVGSCLNI